MVGLATRNSTQPLSGTGRYGRMNTRSTASFLIVELEDTPVRPEQVARLRAALQCELAHVARRTPEPARAGIKTSLLINTAAALRTERKRLIRRTRSNLRSATRQGIRVMQLPTVGPEGATAD